MNPPASEREMQDDQSSTRIGTDLVELLGRIHSVELEHACRSLAAGRAAPQVLEQFANGVAARFLHGSKQVFNRAEAARTAAFRPLPKRIDPVLGTELVTGKAANRTCVETASLALADRPFQEHCGENGTSAPIDSAAPGLDRIRLRRVLDYIVANVKVDITLADLATVAGYSAFHFARKFTLTMGIPPHRYISRLRLENAMVELAAGKRPLVDIALDAKFSSQASFTRAFHRATGMTPKEYRRRRP